MRVAPSGRARAACRTSKWETRILLGASGRGVRGAAASSKHRAPGSAGGTASGPVGSTCAPPHPQIHRPNTNAALVRCFIVPRYHRPWRKFKRARRFKRAPTAGSAPFWRLPSLSAPVVKKDSNVGEWRVPVDGDLVHAPGVDVVDKALLWRKVGRQTASSRLRILQA